MNAGIWSVERALKPATFEAPLSSNYSQTSWPPLQEVSSSIKQNWPRTALQDQTNDALENSQKVY